MSQDMPFVENLAAIEDAEIVSEDSKMQKIGGKKTKWIPPNAGKGRKKGILNRNTAAIKEMIEGALADAGGRDYLARQAIENPAAFMGLIGKILPRDINHGGQVDNPITIESIKLATFSEVELNQIENLMLKVSDK